MSWSRRRFLGESATMGAVAAVWGCAPERRLQWTSEDVVRRWGVVAVMDHSIGEIRSD